MSYELGANEESMFKFEDLVTYKEALLFTAFIYRITEKFPKSELFASTNQLRRASVSIALNIAEGTSRTRKEFSHFLDMSRGSCFECVALLTISFEQNYISSIDYQHGYQMCEKLSKMINALKKSLNSKLNS